MAGVSVLRVLALSFVLLVAGCGVGTVTVSKSAGSALLPAGEVLEIDFGYVNPSVGDSWYLVGKPDTAVLKDVGDDVDFEGLDDQPGVGGEMVWRFEALRPGTSTLRFQYCFQSSPPDCEGHSGPAPEPIQLDVTVQAD